MTDFTGAKVALIHRAEVLVILRDDLPGLPWAGYWDLPGGGREGDETPETCVLREVEEEIGLRLAPGRLIWRSDHPSTTRPGAVGVFFAADLSPEDIAAVRFGNEGQGWRMMPLAEFLAHPKAVPFLQDRLRGYLSRSGSRWILP
ncbi:MAG: NUDIX domain-containing protein [Rhodobacteraceae bacterium]|nr:NUDIX domain-containing protein [Paracoccaceae bacterium]